MTSLRRFELFTLSEIKTLKTVLKAFAPVYGDEMQALYDEVADELGERFNELQEVSYVG